MDSSSGDDVFDCISLLHSVGAVVMGLAVLLWELPSHRFWDFATSGVWVRSASSWEMTVLSCSLVYFALDTLQLLVRRQSMAREHRIAYLCHHAVCASGLLVSLLFGVDGTLVLCGLVLGEIANPPRLLSQLGERLARRRDILHPKGLQGMLLRWRATLFTVHYGLFIITRVCCVDFVVKVAYVHAQSVWTLGACTCLDAHRLPRHTSALNSLLSAL
jgi:hypothetical protein